MRKNCLFKSRFNKKVFIRLKFTKVDRKWQQFRVFWLQSINSATLLVRETEKTNMVAEPCSNELGWVLIYQNLYNIFLYIYTIYTTSTICSISIVYIFVFSVNDFYLLYSIINSIKSMNNSRIMNDAKASSYERQ